MPQYVQQLAEQSTPVTRHDMLTSLEITMQKKVKEPLYFQYPEVRRTPRVVLSEHPPC